MLRAAAALSTGSYYASGRFLPEALALTMGPRELLGPAAPGFEGEAAALLYARRTGKIKKPAALLNLGWGELRSIRDYGPDAFPFGALGAAVQQAGGKTISLGSADTFIPPKLGVPLREWSLLASDADGAVGSGDVSVNLLARDRAAPFGVRANLRAMMQTFDRATTGEELAVITVEWGDTRRAARYAPWCSPEIASAHRWAALTSADRFLQALIGGERLNATNDRLVVIGVPDLDTAAPQWLPMVFWRPLRGSQGALLHAPGIGEQPGVVSLESVQGMLISRLPQSFSAPMNVVPREVGAPSSSVKRLRRLLALQAGTNWLDEARDPLHALWALLIVAAMTLSLLSLSSGAKSHIPASGARWARAAWGAAMIVPLLLWLFGLCIEATWRFGALSDGGGQAQPSWKLVASLIGVALLALWTLGAARGWFQQVRLNGARIGMIWLWLTLIGLWVGGFALPWNALLGDSLLEMQAIAVRLGEVWGLLLISATLAGAAGLASRHAARMPFEPGSQPPAAAPTDDEGAPLRRVINLRPALFWMTGITLILFFWGRNAPVATVAAMGFGVMALRLSFERAPRATRVRWRRGVVAMAFVFLLLWQRGSVPTVEQTLAAWWPHWLAQWSHWWWTLACLATFAGAVSFLTGARGLLRSYLHTRYAMRAGLSAATVAAVSALVIYGPMGPALIGLYTLGAVMYEVLGATDAVREK